VDEETQIRLQAIQTKIRRDEPVSEDELRDLILAAREGRRSAAAGAGKKARASAPKVPISVSTLFPALTNARPKGV
jgi:hypothetical protein